MEIIWGKKEITEGETYRWRCGQLRFWVRYRDGVWETALSREAGASHPPDWKSGTWPINSVIEKVNFACAGKTKSLYFEPVFPQRSLVVRPADRVEILPGEETTYFVPIPLSLRIRVGDKDGSIMTTVPSQVLSDTWFGDNFEGELCFAVRLRAKRRIDEIKPAPHQIILPVILRNKAVDNFVYQKVCLQTTHLGIFLRSNPVTLWSSPVALTHEHKDGPMIIDTEEADPFLQDGQQTLQERKPQEKQTAIRKSFNRISQSLFQ